MNHLTLKQCLMLKEIGFSQELARGSWYYSKGRGRAKEYHSWSKLPTLMIQKRPKIWLPKFYVACPTLEELIGWLGTDFMSLEKHYTGDSGIPHEHYYAKGVRLEVYPTGRKQSYPHVEGDSPLEAVYKLAIAAKGGG